MNDLSVLSHDIGAAHLSPRTLQFLSLQADMRQTFVERYRHLPVIKTNSITTISAIRKDSCAENACSYLVIGTEFGEILIMDHR